MAYSPTNRNRYVYSLLSQTRNGAGSLTTVYFNTPAAGHWTDKGVNQPEYRLKQPLRLDRSLWGPGRTRGDYQIGYGSSSLENGDGGLDAYIGYALEGVRHVVSLNYGDASSYLLFDGQAERCDVGEGEVVIACRDAFYPLGRMAPANVYAGTNALPNGVEGVATDLKGQRKPMIVGLVFNYSPPCVNTSRLIYQVDGQQGLLTGWAMTVYDKRVVLTAGANYTSQADMETTAPAAGQYRVWPAGGMFRLGSAPTGKITCDVTNPCTINTTYTEPDPTDGSQLHAVLRYLLQYSAAWPGTAQATLISNVITTWPKVGIVIQGGMTYLDAVNELLKSIAGGLNVFTAGAYVHQARSVTAASPDFTLDLTNIQSRAGVKVVASADDDRGIPTWKVNVQYKRNETIMTDADVAGASLVDLDYVKKEYLVATASDASVKTQWPNAYEFTVATRLTNETDAQAEADRLLALYKVLRNTYQVSASIGELVRLTAGSFPDPGDVVTLKYPRFSLSAGKRLLCTGVSIDAAGDTVAMTLWG